MAAAVKVEREDEEVNREIKEEDEEEGGEGEGGAKEASGLEMNQSMISEGVSQEYALSSTLHYEEKGEEDKQDGI